MVAFLERANQEDAPEGVTRYEHIDQVPILIKNYWRSRHTIFSKFDEGIWMTDESWFGVTSEPIAKKIARHMAEAAPKTKTILIDAFAGAGGNTIAFALSGRWDRVFAIEKDPLILQCAKHNAKLYGVESKIWWIEGDCFSVLKKQLKGVGKNAVIFGSPPWGGPAYRDERVFDLSSMQPYSIDVLYEAFSNVTPDIALYLPRSSNLNQLAKHQTDANQKLQAVHYCLDGHSKALCAYYGDFKSI